MAKPISLLILLVLLILTPVEEVAAQEKEYIIVSGGVSLMLWEQYNNAPHDLWWMNFIRAGRIRIEELREEHGPDARITWLVYRRAYERRAQQEGQDLIDLIESVQRRYHVDLIWFNQGSEIIDHLNRGHPRNRVKIANFEYFGHSNKSCFMFDYSNEIDTASKSWLHEDELHQIRRGIFTPDAFVKSWGCHTGESMSRKWLEATGVPMWGAVGKTRYRTHELPFISTAGGRWTTR